MVLAVLWDRSGLAALKPFGSPFLLELLILLVISLNGLFTLLPYLLSA